MRKKIFQTAIKIFLVSFVLAATVFNFSAPSAKAGSFTGMLDKLDRLKKGETTSHVFNFSIPAGVDWDSTGSKDDIIIDFPASFSMVTGWTTIGFFLGDTEGGGGAMVTVFAVNEAAGSLTYPSCVGAGLNDTVVAVDTTNNDFGFRLCTGGSDAGSGMAWVFYTWTGAMTNPAAAGSQQINFSMTDEGVAAAHSGALAVGIVDDDQVQVTATVDPTLSFDIDLAYDVHNNSGPPFDLDLGTISLSAVKTSDGPTNTVYSIWLDLNSNASGGAVITIKDDNTGLLSTATGHTIASANAALSPGTEGYGVCLKTINSGVGYPPFTGACNYTTKHTVGGLTTTPAPIFGGGAGPVASGEAEVLVKAAISAATAAAGDYADTLTFIATGTF